MPFANSGTDVEKSLSRALASEVNSLLMKSNSIDVIGFESAASPVLRDLGAPAIAARLNVEHVLAGNVTTRGSRLRIDLQLLDRGGRALWDSVIDDSLDNLFTIQEDIAVSIETLLGAGDDAVPVADCNLERLCPNLFDPSPGLTVGRAFTQVSPLVEPPFVFTAGLDSAAPCS